MPESGVSVFVVEFLEHISKPQPIKTVRQVCDAEGQFQAVEDAVLGVILEVDLQACQFFSCEQIHAWGRRKESIQWSFVEDKTMGSICFRHDEDTYEAPVGLAK